ncbi:MAG: precorrin-3B synthase [Pseudorhodobacter sp.]|nr:precorrin-3B synthase [Pseudorhodobacter sp.]
MKAPIIQGWCPGALRPMLSGDGLVVRLRPHCGRLSSDQAAGIAALARAHGNGVIDLSARANLQLRGVTPAAHPALIEGLRSLGLIDVSAEVEARRNIVVTPFWTVGDGTATLAAGLTQALAGADAPALPGKFGFALDTGPAPVLRQTAADIRLERQPEGGLIVRADGCAMGAPVTQATAVATALALAHWFVASGGARDGRGRMAAHIARGVAPPAAFTTVRAAPWTTHPTPGPGTYPLGQMVGFAFGQMSAETLAALAELGPLRVTPWRLLLIEALTAAPASAPDLTGLITAPDDPMLRVFACTGAPGCPQAHQPTRPLARALAPHIPPGSTAHVSGCAKGCAHPGRATLTLVAQPQGFAVLRKGAPADSAGPALSTATLLEHPETLFEAPDAACL